MLGLAKAQSLVANIKEASLEDVGLEQWATYHERLERLNIASIQQSQQKHDEYVANELIVESKVLVLIKNLIIIETWKSKIYPLIIEHKDIKTNQALATKLYLIVKYKICYLFV